MSPPAENWDIHPTASSSRNRIVRTYSRQGRRPASSSLIPELRPARKRAESVSQPQRQLTDSAAQIHDVQTRASPVRLHHTSKYQNDSIEGTNDSYISTDDGLFSPDAEVVAGLQLPSDSSASRESKRLTPFVRSSRRFV